MKKIARNEKIRSDLKRGVKSYACMMHSNCRWGVKFGTRKIDCKIILKNCYPTHSGLLRSRQASDGRKWKTRKMPLLDKTIEKVCMVKSAKPVPQDIMKTAGNVDGFVVSYNQAWRAADHQKKGKQIMSENRFRKSFHI
jgi:hypothetical protein